MLIDKTPAAGEHGEERASSVNTVYLPEDYHQAALLLSRTYPAMKSERENIRRWQGGEKKYEEGDALEELISITSKNDEALGVRVQISGVSDPTGDIATLLAGGYAKKRQNEIMRQLFTPEMMDYTDYLDCKISLVEGAMEERMTKLQKAIYQLLFFKNFSYSQLIQKNKGKRHLNDRKINLEKNKALDAVAREIEAEAGYERESGAKLIQRLMEEVKKDRAENAAE